MVALMERKWEPCFLVYLCRVQTANIGVNPRLHGGRFKVKFPIRQGLKSPTIAIRICYLLFLTCYLLFDANDE